MNEMAFRLDHPQFESMTAAFMYILGHYQVKENPHLWGERPSGLICSKEVPAISFAESAASIQRPRQALRG
jgi:hypothetical protein